MDLLTIDRRLVHAQGRLVPGCDPVGCCGLSESCRSEVRFLNCPTPGVRTLDQVDWQVCRFTGYSRQLIQFDYQEPQEPTIYEVEGIVGFAFQAGRHLTPAELEAAYGLSAYRAWSSSTLPNALVVSGVSLIVTSFIAYSWDGPGVNLAPLPVVETRADAALGVRFDLRNAIPTDGTPCSPPQFPGRAYTLWEVVGSRSLQRWSQRYVAGPVGNRRTVESEKKITLDRIESIPTLPPGWIGPSGGIDCHAGGAADPANGDAIESAMAAGRPCEGCGA